MHSFSLSECGSALSIPQKITQNKRKILTSISLERSVSLPLICTDYIALLKCRYAIRSENRKLPLRFPIEQKYFFRAFKSDNVKEKINILFELKTAF